MSGIGSGSRKGTGRTMLATAKIEVTLVVLLVLNLVGMTITAWHIMRRK